DGAAPGESKQERSQRKTSRAAGRGNLLLGPGGAERVVTRRRTELKVVNEELPVLGAGFQVMSRKNLGDATAQRVIHVGFEILGEILTERRDLAGEIHSRKNEQIPRRNRRQVRRQADTGEIKSLTEAVPLVNRAPETVSHVSDERRADGKYVIQRSAAVSARGDAATV